MSCKHCTMKELPEIKINNEFYIVRTALYHWTAVNGWSGTEIDYCPWCGEPLSLQAKILESQGNGIKKSMVDKIKKLTQENGKLQEEVDKITEAHEEVCKLYQEKLAYYNAVQDMLMLIKNDDWKHGRPPVGKDVMLCYKLKDDEETYVNEGYFEVDETYLIFTRDKSFEPDEFEFIYWKEKPKSFKRLKIERSKDHRQSGRNVKRITNRTENRVAYVTSETGEEGTGAFTTQRRIPEIISRLADIEDILGKEYDLEALKEIFEAKEQGRMIVLPKDGMVYYIEEADGERWISNKPIREIKMRYGWGLVLLECSIFDKGKYFSREEAEEALKKMEK